MRDGFYAEPAVQVTKTCSSKRQWAKAEVMFDRTRHSFLWSVWICGAVAVGIGGYWLASWMTGAAARSSAAGIITVKTNMALAQVLAGVSLLLLCPERTRRWRWMTGILAGFFALALGALTLGEHLFGWKLGIDQLLAHEAPGASATTSPNRMGPPGSASVMLLGLGLLALGWRRRWAPYFGITVCLVILFPLVGYFYDIGAFYSNAGLTGIAWPTVIALTSLGLGLVLGERRYGPMELLLRPDAGGMLTRRFLPAVVLVPLALGYLKVLGTNLGIFSPSVGSGVQVVALVVIFSLMLWRNAALLSAAASAHAKAEEALRAKEAELAFMLGNTPFMLTRCSRDLRYLSVSQAYAEMVRTPPEELAGKPILSVLGEKGFETIRPHVEAVLRGERVEYEAAVDFPRVGVRHLSVVYIPDLDVQKQVVGWVASVIDVTERNRSREALVQSDERVKQAVRVAGLGTFEHDHISDRVTFSGLMREISGFGEEEEISLSEILERIVPEDRETFAAAIRKAHDPEGDGMFEVEYRMSRRQGPTRWISARAQTFFEGTGIQRRPVRTIGAALDVTERKRAQSELELLVSERTARLQEVVAELEHFSYTITHDMKSPLRAMRGFAEMVKLSLGDCERKEAIEFLGRISTAAERMDRLITDALNFSRAVRQQLPLEDVDAGRLLREMLDTYPEFQASKADIRVEGKLPVVLANQAGLTQCFSNLLGNAVKFVRPGKRPEIRIWAGAPDAEDRVPHANAGQWVRIWVEDKGIGISKEMLPRIFDMFSQGDRAYEGTGIGLALVRKVTQRMGGQAGVQSEEGIGSRFWLELKCGAARASPEQTVLPALSIRHSELVLYVEDEEGDVLFMKRAFERGGLGGKLKLAADGRSAIEYLSGAGKYGNREEFPLPTLVLLDLNLPQVPGFEVLKWMRNHPDFARLPVVVFSSSSREEDRVRAQELGANDFVSKPNSGLGFGEVIQRLRQKWLGQPSDAG